MPMTLLGPHATTPTIRNREQLDAVVENIVLLQREQVDLERAQSDEIAAIREKYRAPLTEVDRYLQMETCWAETWLRQNPTALPPDRALDCPHAKIGFRTMPPRVDRASRRWTWTEAATKLAEVAWGKRYLRTPAPEIDKEAVLSDFAILPPEKLREVGIKILQGERFFVEPHLQAEEARPTGTDWQEAA